MRDRPVGQAKRLGILSCPRREPLRNIARRMADDDISALVVVESDGALAGIITRSDILRAGLSAPDWPNEPAEKFMTDKVVAVTPDTLLSEVMALLLSRHIHRVVVVREESGRRVPIAVISDSDLVCEMADEVE